MSLRTLLAMRFLPLLTAVSCMDTTADTGVPPAHLPCNADAPAATASAQPLRIQGVVLSPDGTPAANAEITFATRDSTPKLTWNEDISNSHPRRRKAEGQTAVDGRFDVAAPFERPILLLASHASGYAEIPTGVKSDALTTVRLAPWGALLIRKDSGMDSHPLRISRPISTLSAWSSAEIPWGADGMARLDKLPGGLLLVTSENLAVWMRIIPGETSELNVNAAPGATLAGTITFSMKGSMRALRQSGATPAIQLLMDTPDASALPEFESFRAAASPLPTLFSLDKLNPFDIRGVSAITLLSKLNVNIAPRSVTLSEDGSFSVPRLPAGSYILTRLTGIGQESIGRATIQPADAAAGAAVTMITTPLADSIFPLKPSGAAMEGVVLDSSGKPVPSALIRIEPVDAGPVPLTAKEFSSATAPAFSCVSASDGSFSVEIPRSFKTRLAVFSERAGMAVVRNPRRSDTTTVRLAPWSGVKGELWMPPAHCEWEVTLGDDARGLRLSLYAESDGSFLAGKIPAGSYELVASLSDSEAFVEVATYTFHLDVPDIGMAAFHAATGPDVTGTFTLDSNAATSEGLGECLDARLVLKDKTSTPPSETAYPSEIEFTVKPDGGFAIPCVPPGEYEMTVEFASLHDGSESIAFRKSVYILSGASGRIDLGAIPHLPPSTSAEPTVQEGTRLNGNPNPNGH